MKKLLSVFLAVLMCVLPLAGNMSVMAAGETATPDATYTFSDATGYAGDEITVEISLTTDSKFNTVGFSGITYDENFLTFVKATIDPDLKDLATLSRFDNNKMSLAAAIEETQNSYDGTICTLTFKINEDAPVDTTQVSVASTALKLNSTTLDVEVVPATVTVKGLEFEDLIFENDTVTYDSNIHTIEVKNVPEIASVEYKLKDGSDFTGAEDAGTYNVVATVTAPGYTSKPLEATLTIEEKDLTINAVVPGKVYDGATDIDMSDVDVTVEGVVEGDDVAFDAEDSWARFVSKDIGSVEIEYELVVVGDDAFNYKLICNVPKASITKRPATITAVNKTVKIGEAIPELTVVTDGVVEGETLVYTVTTTAKNTNTVKTYPITVNADAKKNPNYDITVVNGVLSVIDKTAQDVTVAPVENKTYGDDDFKLEAVVGEVANESKVVFTSETPDVVSVTDEGWATIVGAGTAKITVTKAGDADYADFSETVTFTVAKKALTITADSHTVRVGSAMPELTYKQEGLVKGDTLTGALATSAKNTSTVKTYPITQGTLKASANYTVTFVAGTLSVIAKDVQDVVVEDIEGVTYGDGIVELVVTEGENVTDSLVVYTAETSNISVDSDGYITILGAGTAKVTVTKAGDADYADFSKTVTFTVAKKALTITADNKTATKGGALPKLTYTVEGLVDGDALTGDLATTAKNTNTVKTYPITQGTLKASANYTVTFVPGTLSVIDKLPQTITVTSNVPSDLTYGDEGFKIDVAYGETVTDAQTVFASSNNAIAAVDAEGNVTIVGAGEATITVSKAGNDTIADFEETIEITVAKKPITITAKDDSKKVGNADPELGYEFDESQLVGDDAISGNVAREAGEEVGTYIIGPGTLSLTNSANYDVNFVGGTFTIFDKTPQNITVTQSYSKTYGDSAFELDVTYGTSDVSENETTFVSDNEEVATVDENGNVTIVGAGTAKITVAKAGNADLADFTKTVTVTVAKKAIKVIAVAKEKYVGEETPELTYTLEGELVGDDAFTGELAVSDGNKAGKSYDIKIGTLALNDNYKVTFVGAKLTVLAKVEQQITVSDVDTLVYGEDTGFSVEITYDGEYNTDSAITYESSNEDVVAVDAEGNVTIVGAGDARITVAFEGSNKFYPYEETIFVYVEKADIDFVLDDRSKKIGTEDPAFTWTLEGTIYGDTTVVGAPEREAGEELGTYEINPGTLSVSDPENYNIGYVYGTFTIVEKNPQTVEVTGIPETVTYGDGTFTITTTSAEVEGASVAFVSDNESVLSVDENGVVTVVGAGVATITITVAGNDDYSDAVVPEGIIVKEKEITISALDLVNKTVEFEGLVGEDVLSVDFGSLSVAPEEGDEPANYVVTGFALTGEKAVNYTLATESYLVAISDDIELVNVSVIAENGLVEGAGSYLAGSEVTLKAEANSGYKFTGWYVGEEKVSSEAEYTFAAEADIEVTAKFAKKATGGSGSGVSTPTRIVYFQTAEGEISAVSVKKGAKVARPEDPTLEGYNFEGWYVDAEYTEEFDFDTAIEDSVTVYAKWSKVDEEPGEEPGEDPGEDPVEWNNPFADVDDNDWFYETVKEASSMGLMNGMTDKSFAPSVELTRAMLVTILYRADGEEAVDGDVAFEDVDLDAYYGDALVWATENGIVNGLNETEFAPNANITREQIATIMFRYAVYKGLVAVDLSENLSFKDADEISGYAVSAMNWAVGQGIMTGYDNNTLRPKNNATRAEVATIVVRFLAKLG